MERPRQKARNGAMIGFRCNPQSPPINLGLDLPDRAIACGGLFPSIKTEIRATLKPILVNAGIGGWYQKGSTRLQQSFVEHGFEGAYNIWDRWPTWNYSKDSIYAVKAAAMEHAMKAGFRTLIWADCSIWALRPVKPFLDEVEVKGYWIGQSGYKASETATDAQLEYFGLTRDEVDLIPDCASGLFAVNLDHEKPRQFLETWIQAAKDGAFGGSRGHDGQSADPRFKFGRQDQSAASCILGKLGMKLDLFQDYCAFAWDSREKAIFACQGM